MRHLFTLSVSFIFLSLSANAALQRSNPSGQYMNNYTMTRTADGGYLVTMQQGFQRIFVNIDGRFESLYLADNGKFHSSNFRCSESIPVHCYQGKPLSDAYIAALEQHAEGKTVVSDSLGEAVIYIKAPDGKIYKLVFDGRKWFTPVLLTPAEITALGLNSGSSSSSTSSSSGSGSSSSSSGSSSNGGDPDEEGQDDDVVDNNHNGSDPLCQLTGTCNGTSSSTSSSGGSSSSSSGSIGNIGSPFLGFYKRPPEGLNVPVRLHEMFTGRKNGWAPSEGGGGMYDGVARSENNPQLRSIVTYALIPSSERSNGQPLQRCAAGQFDEHYRKFGNAMKAKGISSIIIRPGWEWTLSSWAWGTGNDVSLAPVYASCFRRFVDAVRNVYPENKFLIDWNIHQDASPASMAAGWPGDNYVDIIGVDIYDAYYGPASCANDPACRWSNRTQKVLDKVHAFAQSKNKPTSIPELGIWSGGNDNRGGGDNPYFIQKICEWVKNPANRVVYYAYFNANADGDHRLQTHPRSLAAFNQHCVGNPGNPHTLLQAR